MSLTSWKEYSIFIEAFKGKETKTLGQAIGFKKQFNKYIYRIGNS